MGTAVNRELRANGALAQEMAAIDQRIAAERAAEASRASGQRSAGPHSNPNPQHGSGPAHSAGEVSGTRGGGRAHGTADSPMRPANGESQSVVQIPGRGTLTETIAPRPMRPQGATDRWDEFLGEGVHTNRHPRTGRPDSDRIVSEDGRRSIRYGDHEMGSNPNSHHYHEETWHHNTETNTMDVDNTVVRVPNQSRGNNGNSGN